MEFVKKYQATFILIIPALLAWLIIFRFNLFHDFLQSDLLLQHLIVVFENLGIPNVYDFFQLGGTVLRPIIGYIPLEVFLSFFISNEIKVMTLMSVVICSLNGVYGALIMFNMTKVKQKHVIYSFVFLIFAFLPSAAWRISSGHTNFLLGINLFLLISLYVSLLLKNNLNKLFYYVIFLSLINLFTQPPMAQVSFYIVLFYVPLILFIYKRRPELRKSINIFIGIVFLALLLSWDQIFLFLKYQSSGEFARSEEPAIYSFLTLRGINQFATFIGSNVNLRWLGVGEDVFHEINYPIGVGTLVLSAFYFFKSKNNTKWFLLAFSVFSFFYTSGYFGFDEVFRVIPIFNMFRVPSRIYLVTSLVLTLLVIYKITKEEVIVPGKYLFVYLLIPLVFVYVDPFFIEILLLSLVIYKIFRKAKYTNFLLLVFISTLFLASFKEKILFMKFNPQKKYELNKKIEGFKTPGVFENGNSLYTDPYLGRNTAAFYKIPSIQGYNFPIKSFLETYSYLMNLEYIPTRIVFEHQVMPPFLALSNLYNINIVLDLSDANNVVKKRFPLEENRSPLYVRNFENKEEQLKYMQQNYHLYEYVQNNVTTYNQSLPTLEKCFYEKQNLNRNLTLKLLNPSKYPCLIVLPFNNSDFLSVANEDVKKITVDNTLIGLFIKQAPQDPQVVISPMYDFSNYIIIKVLLWGLLVMGLLFFIISKHFSKSTVARC